MKAARFYAAKDIRVEDVPGPAAPKSDEVLLEPAWCGICGTDLHEYVSGPIVTPQDAHPLTGAELPQILGHEFSGRVLATGTGVTHVTEGDRVAVMPLISCGSCYHCLRGDQHLCLTMGCTGLSYQWGGLAEQALVPGYQVTLLPEELTLEQGALLEPAAVAIYGVERARLRAGDIVLVAGLGPIGALVAMSARAMGAGLVLATEPNPNRAARAEELGVDEVIPVGDGFEDRIQHLTDGVGVDSAMECSGTEAGLRSCATAVRAKGTVVQVGLHTGLSSVDPMEWCLKDLSIEATWAYPVHVWPRVGRLVASGRLPIERVVTTRTTLDQVVETGFERLIDPSGDETKVLIESRA